MPRGVSHRRQPSGLIRRHPRRRRPPPPTHSTPTLYPLHRSTPSFPVTALPSAHRASQRPPSPVIGWVSQATMPPSPMLPPSSVLPSAPPPSCPPLPSRFASTPLPSSLPGSVPPFGPARPAASLHHRTGSQCGQAASTQAPRGAGPAQWPGQARFQPPLPAAARRCHDQPSLCSSRDRQQRPGDRRSVDLRYTIFFL